MNSFLSVFDFFQEKISGTDDDPVDKGTIVKE